MRNPSLVAWLLPLALLAAGCIQGAAQDQHPTLVSGDGLVTVRGIVLSEEIFPVPQASVRLDNSSPVLTSEAGAFEIGGVIPGSHLVTVEAAGYENSTLKASVPDNGLDNLRITLKGIPGKAPYVATYIHNGFDVCSFSGVYSAGPLPSGSNCPFGKSDTIFKVEVGADWRAGVHELAWRTNEDMIFASSVSTSDPKHGAHRASCISGTSNGQPFHDWCPAMRWGPSPIRLYARPNDTEYAKKYAIDGKEVWPGGENYTSFIFSSYSGYLQHEINNTFFPACVQVNRQFSVPENWGCPFGIGYSLGIKITYYHTTFYLQAPLGRLEDFTAMPDQ